jgi:hypothetical protein
MRSDDLQARFTELLAKYGGAGPTPRFSALWEAFLAFAAIPVDDAVEQGGGYADTIRFYVEPEEDRPGTRMGLLRGVHRRDSPVMLAILAHFEPLPVAEFETMARGGSEPALREFQRTVEADPGFQLLKSAEPAPHDVEYDLFTLGAEADVDDDPDDETSIRADELGRRFGEILAQHAGDVTLPSFSVIWSAFIDLALIPVRDVSSPGTDDDAVDIAVTPDDRQPGPLLTLSRHVVRRAGPDVHLSVIVDYQPFPLPESFYALAVAGVEAAVAEFVQTVERSPVFEHLQAASATRFEFALDEID